MYYIVHYNSCVCPILNYAAGIWGCEEDKTDKKRDIRCSLGVNKLAPSLDIQGDMGWDHCEIRQRGEII